MPNKIVDQLIDEVRRLRAELKTVNDALVTHLIESGGIKTKLSINTWLTLAIFAALIANYFKR